MPNLKKNIFNKKSINHLLERISQSDISDFTQKQEIINQWINFIQSGNVNSTKETAIQSDFLFDIFTKVPF
ncbi:MAG: hypothetical protein NT007_02665 [Candidatus Kapabacteria bacterium]|nr:hypothetical protein [Candidatus Kapabacteria bacterium]